MSFRMFIPLLIACGDQNANFVQQPSNSNTDPGNPILELSAEELFFVDAQSGIASSQMLTLTSTGDASLEVTKVALSNSVGGLFYMEDVESFTLEPQESKEITIIVTLTQEDFAFGELQIRSSDADNRDRRIPLCANMEGYEITDECSIAE